MKKYMNQKITKGFTLIELLAVIVILAIIALIAVPVILNIIDKANKSAFKDSAYGVLNAAEYYYAASQLELEGPMQDVEFNLPEDKNTLELKGSIPNGKVIITRDGEISLMVKNDRYCVTKGFNDQDIKVTENLDDCEISSGDGNQGTGGNTEKTLADVMVSTTNNCVTSGTCTEAEIAAGVKVTINVKENTPYDFYVIKDDGNKVTLIMDRNLGTQQAWTSEVDYGCGALGDQCSENDKGPITILNYLTSQVNSETETWSNIPAIESYEYINNANGTTNTYGYQKLTITNGTGVLTSQDESTTTLTGTMRARLLTHEEAYTLKTNNGNTTPAWLYDYLSSSNTVENPVGYWFLTSYPFNSDSSLSMVFSGALGSHNFVHDGTLFGSRPVIELSKSL